MIECGFCDSEGTLWDRDLEMALCVTHFTEMNGSVESIELNEVW
jgi:hypothetical protein